MSSRFEAVKSELDKAVKKSALELERHQRTSLEAGQLLSSERLRAKCFETSAADMEYMLTKSEQAQELLSSKLVFQVHALLACLMCTQPIFPLLLSHSLSLQCMLVCFLRLLHPLWRVALHGSSCIIFSTEHKQR